MVSGIHIDIFWMENYFRGLDNFSNSTILHLHYQTLDNGDQWCRWKRTLCTNFWCCDRGFLSSIKKWQFDHINALKRKITIIILYPISTSCKPLIFFSGFSRLYYPPMQQKSFPQNNKLFKPMLLQWREKERETQNFNWKWVHKKPLLHCWNYPFFLQNIHWENKHIEETEKRHWTLYSLWGH